jgi:dihydroxyacetone kinase-like protein
MHMTGTTILEFLRLASARIRDHAAELTELDAAIGDADHGTNLDRGFTAVMARVEGAPLDDIGALLKLVGTTLTSTVGGAAGPLYGTAFVRAGAVLAGRSAIGAPEVASALTAALEGVRARGRAERGEKTMLDAIGPGVEAFQAALEGGADLVGASQCALEAVERGMRATIPMLATKGRASYLGERSIGHQDPGATSAFYLAQALHDTIVACQQLEDQPPE